MEQILISQSTKEESKTELQELLQNIRRVNKIVYFVAGCFFIITLMQKLTGARPITWLLLLLIIVLVAITIIYDFLLRKTRLKESVTRASILYLTHLMILIIAVTLLLHMGGAMFFSGIPFLIAYIFIPYFTFTRGIYRWIAIVFSIVDYLIIITLEHFGILRTPDILRIGIDLARNREVFFTMFTSGIPLLIMVLFLVDTFSRKLRDSIQNLSQKEKELEEAKQVLEIKVEDRTKDLKQLAETLEEKIKARTEELQVRMMELEKFQRLATGRELKMIEIKKENENLKKELEKYK